MNMKERGTLSLTHPADILLKVNKLTRVLVLEPPGLKLLLNRRYVTLGHYFDSSEVRK